MMEIEGKVATITDNEVTSKAQPIKWKRAIGKVKKEIQDSDLDPLGLKAFDPGSYSRLYK